MKRLNQIDTLQVNTDTRAYLVTLEALKNTPSGAPRFKAVIIYLEPRDSYYFNAVYTFTGHYMSRQQEAEWIVSEHEAATRRDA